MRAVALAAAIAATAVSAVASAAPISGYQGEQENATHVNLGWNSAPALELAYGRAIPMERLVRRLDLEIGLALPVFLVPELDAFRLEPAARAMLVQRGGWGLAGRLGLPVQTGDNQTFQFVSVGAHPGLAGGYFERGWFIALEVEYTAILSTYIAASDRARAAYAGIRDGFYAPAGGYLDASLAFGLSIGSSVELGLRAGYRSTHGLEPPPLVPFRAEVGVSYAFGAPAAAPPRAIEP
ncbi:hypothetical protein BE20_03580 [Sorangium cellulosum]|uniref:Secreted protein n=1 Tax=Sorangium cellulosum TaxID=56 RepID=A0A150RHE3_SORCE|nr:hypothetical protein BE18_45095 [Sorangium cellulosum]KYF98594.1 hypothetical protein BE20_03580 [Sorangium cellulosum]